jgi:CelD/BcsL family acetyltransferase involved in cellulose biosynthesis
VSATLQLLAAEELPPLQVQWANLARSAVASNVFYEPWMLLPALEYIRERENLHFLLIWGPAGELWGFLPLQVQTRCLHLPVRTLAFWQHRYCYLTVPLVHAKHVEQVFDAFWRWFERNPLGCRILDTNYFLGEGPFHTAWADFLIGRCMLVLNEHPRGLQTRTGSGDGYTSALLSKKRYHALNRSRRHLETLGCVEYQEVTDGSQVANWVDHFLQLESSGWKGTQDGNAIAKHEADAAYFRAMTQEGFRNDRVTLLALLLDGRPIAMKQLLRDGEGAFIFKIAYDESFAKYSPGVLLELDHLRNWQDGRQTLWMDTCASPRHSLFNLISNERRMIRRTLISNGSRAGDLFLSTLPILRWMRHRLQPKATPMYLRVRATNG